MFPILFFTVVTCYIFYAVSAHIRHGELCSFKEEYICGRIPKDLIKKINMPKNACYIHDCSTCIKTLVTFLITPSGDLISPENFIIRQTRNHTELVHVSDGNILKNPPRISFWTCYFDKSPSNKLSFLQRTLLEYEKATFVNDNLTMTFDDPVLILPDVGRLIIGVEDFHKLYSVPEDLRITLPYELLAFKTQIHLTYIHPNGHTIEGTINVSGKTKCQTRHCIMCMDIFQTLHCYPPVVSYIIYTFIILITLLLLWFVKTIFKTIIYLFQLIFLCMFAIFKILKLLARFSLLCGAYLGSTIQDTVLSIYHFLEHNANRGARIPIMGSHLVLLTLCLLCRTVSPECSTHAIIHSEVRSCENIADGSKTCKVFSTAELSLPAISTEACIWFTDKQENHLFSLKLRLDAVMCNFQTERDYFSFPVRARHISQVSCIYNKYCGKGVHCIPQKIGKEGLNFETESPDTKMYPGISSCSPGGVGTGCTILTRAACNFHRTWFEPDLTHSYEVSKITSHSCKYHISVTHIENNTVSHIALTDSTTTDTGVTITVLGAYDQPQLHIKESFIQRVGNPTEAYLAPTSERNKPVVGTIGAVQANTSFTTDFIFDPSISKCDFFEDRLRCVTANDPLVHLQKSKEHALPMERDMHLFSVKEGKLVSTLLFSSAVRLQLSFSNFKITMRTTTVCPKFDDAPFEIKGCYNCPILARLTFSAHSACQPGIVIVMFQEIQIHTKALTLTTDTAPLVIKFSGDQKCYKEKLCLKAQSVIQCKILDFCLDEASIELLQLNTNFTSVHSMPSNNNWWDWINLPNFSSSLYLLKFIGSGLFILCIIITILSTLITCCCRAR